LVERSERDGPAWRAWRVFCGGLLLGLAMVVTCGWSLLRGLAEHGLTVTIDQEAVATAVAREVGARLTAELPRALHGLEMELPARMAGPLRARLATVKIDFDWGTVSLPEPILTQVERAVTEAVAAGLKAGLAAMPAQRGAQALAVAAGQAVRSGLGTALSGQRFTIRLLATSIPVRVQTK
jgi:hypothetical protein